jgi:hypothetical protein
LDSWPNKILGLLQKPLPQKIKEVDMRFVDYYNPMRESWQRKLLPGFLVDLIDDRIG